MAKKHQPPGPSDLRARIERTRREGKYQQALDLVKQLYKAQPTSEHKELLKDTYLHRAAQLRGQNYLRDAITVLEVATELDEHDAAWQGRLAAEAARCGDVARALAFAARLSEDARGPILGPLVDSAVQQGKTGRDALPAALQAEYDLIVGAFAHTEAGRDEQARDALGAIGLRSPFLEWKVLLRGLQAYYTNDDDRARDNWQRLSPDRLPARLAAPFRAAVDPAYRDAQPPPVRAALAQQREQIEGNPDQKALRELRADFGNPDQSGRAYRNAEQLLPRVKQQSPHLAARLARCFYWSLLETSPDDINRYRRAFGAPPDDRNFHRLQAIGYQRGGSFTTAHEHWLAYEKEIAAHPEAWPGDQAALARALVWLQMAENAALVPTEQQLEKLPAFARMLQGLPPALKPTAEECFGRSIELAPTLLDAHEGLFDHHRLQGQDAKAVAAAERLLKTFPDHVETLDTLGGMYLKRDKPAEAVPLLERALSHNPLSRELRFHMQLAQSARARQLAAKDKFDDARRHFEATVAFSEANDLCAVYCQWAACETKAGDDARADELLALARAKSPGELLITYNLLVEANRLKLPNAFKTKYTKAFNADIAGTGTPALAVALARFVFSLDAVDVNYHGRATHWKKIFEYAFRVPSADYTENQLDSLLGSLVHLDPPKRPLAALIGNARARYPDNPFFVYYDLIAVMGDDPDAMSRDLWRATRMVEHAEELARKRPTDARLEALLDDLSHRREALRLLNPMGGLLGGINFGSFFGPGDDDDFEDDDEW